MKKIDLGSFSACIIIAALYLLLTLPQAQEKAEGKLIICVYDGFMQTPVQNAKVVIPETEQILYTDTSGKTEAFSVPIVRDTHFDDIKPQNYGRITVLVYADGYLPYALFFAQVTPDKTRRIDTWLFEDDGSEPFIIIESPEKEWAFELIDEYQ